MTLLIPHVAMGVHWLPLTCVGVDTRSKGPLLNLDNTGGAWPPPHQGSDGSSLLMEPLEAPLLAPSAPPLHLAAEVDDCFLDDTILSQVGVGPSRAALHCALMKPSS